MGGARANRNYQRLATNLSLYSGGELFKIILKDITAGGNVTGVDFTVDRELRLKKRLEVETDFGSVKFNPDVGEITFGKGLKSSDDEQGNDN